MTLGYSGTDFSGWQRQPNARSVQETLESAFSTILQQPIEITGCGRTDAGVHARYYVAHVDIDKPLPPGFQIGINSLLPDSIAVHTIVPVQADAHARFDAFERSYVYEIALRKDPFRRETAWFFPQYHKLDLQAMSETAALLLEYEHFSPFCKSNSGVDSYQCLMKRVEWLHEPEAFALSFHISANRFLRGMVRLVVGACIQTGMGQLRLADVRDAMDRQVAMPKSLSVPAHGLALTAVKYPFSF